MTHQEVKKLYELLGRRIRDARVRIGLKQESLGELLSLSRTSIVNIEKGRQRPSLHTLYSMAVYLDVDLDILLPPLDKEMVNSERSNLSPEWQTELSRYYGQASMDTHSIDGGKLQSLLSELTKSHDNETHR